jgi:hypothetical protein
MEEIKGQTLLKEREGKLSRGLAFGSPEYVKDAILRFRDARTTRTRILPYGSWRGEGLCCVGRGAEDGGDKAQ